MKQINKPQNFNKILKTTITFLVLVAAFMLFSFTNKNKTSKSKVNNKAKLELKQNFSQLKVTSDLKLNYKDSVIYKNEVASIKKQFEKINFDSKKDYKIAVLNDNLAYILWKQGVKINAISFSPFLNYEIQEKRMPYPTFSKYCDSEYFTSNWQYLDEPTAQKFTKSKQAKAGCYKAKRDINTKYTLTKTKPRDRTYSKYNEDSIHNFGNRYSLDLEVLKKQKTNLVVVDKVFAFYYSDLIKKLEKENIDVITLDTQSLEAELAIINVFSKTLTKDMDLFNYYKNSFEKELVDYMNRFSEYQKPKKVLLLYSYKKDTYVLQKNSYLASWMKQIGYEVFVPKTIKHNKYFDKQKISIEEIKKAANNVDLIINTSHAIFNKQNYEKAYIDFLDEKFVKINIALESVYNSPQLVLQKL